MLSFNGLANYNYFLFDIFSLSKPITEDQSPTTPGSSRSYSTDNSPVPTSSHKMLLSKTPTPTSSTTQRYTPTSSKRPFPAARLFTSPTSAKNARTPSMSNRQFSEKPTTDADNDDGDAYAPTANSAPEIETPMTKVEPVEEQQQSSISTLEPEKLPHEEDPPLPAKRRRSTITDKERVGEKSDSKKETDLSIVSLYPGDLMCVSTGVDVILFYFLQPPFESIITTRRQAAKLAAMATTTTPSTRSTLSSLGSSKRRK